MHCEPRSPPAYPLIRRRARITIAGGISGRLAQENAFLPLLPDPAGKAWFFQTIDDEASRKTSRENRRQRAMEEIVGLGLIQ